MKIKFGSWDKMTALFYVKSQLKVIAIHASMINLTDKYYNTQVLIRMWRPASVLYGFTITTGPTFTQKGGDIHHASEVI